MIVGRELLVLAGGRADEARDHEPAAADPEKDERPQGLERVDDDQVRAGDDPRGSADDVGDLEALDARGMRVVQRDERHDREEDRRRDVHPRGGLQDVHDDRDAVPRGGEAHEVVVVGLFAVVRVAEQGGDDDDDHHDDRHGLWAEGQVQRHEQCGQEGPRQVVDEVVDDAAVEPRDGVAHADLAGEGAIDSVHDQGDDEPQPHHGDVVVEDREQGERRPHEARDGERVDPPRGDDAAQAGFVCRGRGLGVVLRLGVDGSFFGHGGSCRTGTFRSTVCQRLVINR